MKKMISIFLALATMGCVVSYGWTKGPESQMAVVKTGEVVKVIYKSPARSNVNVTISDAEGNEVFAERLTSDKGFIRPYNFSLLPKGEYTISLNDKDGEHSESISTKSISTHNTDWMAHVTELQSTGKKYMVAIPYQDANDIAIRIYDQNEQLIYSETDAVSADFAKIFNFPYMDTAVTVRVVNLKSGEEKVFHAE